MLFLDLEKQFQRIVKYIPETIATEVVSEDPAVAPLKMKELVNILGDMRN